MPQVLVSALLAASLLQVALIYLPAVSWPFWLAHFVALETCLAATATGVAAALLADSPVVRGFGVLGALGGLIPALAIVPTFVREGQPFSPTEWLFGGPSAKVSVEREVEVAPGLYTDVFHAPGPGPHPFVVVVHGGSWRSGDKGEAPRVSHALAQAGYVVFDVRYRLAPTAPFPAAVIDVRRVLSRVQEQAARWEIDPARGAVLGRSAGAQIALLVAYADRRLDPADGVEGPPLRAVAAFYAPTDLAWDHANPYVPDVVDGTNALEVYLGGTPRDNPSAYQLGTPQTWLDHSVPPTLLVHGTAERCVRPENAERLRDALIAAGQSVRTLFVPFADHGFDLRPGGFGEQLSRGVLFDFLRDSV